ncbi:MAG: hypothetical protein COT39_00720 [Parcubacteria group bacterium CG08_land_8_20_14_0_20_48_21]|nr:MAG: hypothetical protein AUK21_03640 [Parcubacteria group bacterium CG2_30_48_51]PIS33184.1 MAG: hypothetical protein COT39_00720 [Parcubacteria group bacterium CG08_land_8_20_14_0_20_48_21]PIW79427.1 MAG: hypothetical protein COZ99_01245 [Parcubacteria group bacterium CG_4_8_14_3_um_filter_48_16]PIY77688.1 MAG: hypothetical protein COY83_04070 [Parcubacteria group bacterium CG_4_10_14_0_8_um_filter_48_154]PIZ77464.1 MAG: hypothetical protein COY03_02930 [bacterium CG_4_10_14_0_2_um_filter_
MTKHKEQRVGVFVDVQNMYHSAKNLYGANANFKEILEAATADRKLIRALAYVIKSDSAEEETFFDALFKQGFEVHMKDLQIFAGGSKKGDWDIGMAVDSIKMANKLDVVVLVTGDGDFIPLVQYLQHNKGCLAEVIAFGETTSQRLMEAADDFIDLSLDKKRFLLKKY